MTEIQPTVNAILNAACALLLVWGRARIKAGERTQHKRIMLTAAVVSALFLTSYLIYHSRVGSVPYPRHDWTRTVYFAILIPHSVLAGLNVPFILTALILALKGRFAAHRRLVRWVWPVWVFVSLSGLAVYGMLYRI